MKTQRKQENAVIRIFTDGSGSRPDGKGSAIAWLREDSGERKFDKIDGLMNNEAEYRAVLSALQTLPNKRAIQVFSDSELVCCQFTGKWRVSDPSPANLLSKIRELIRSKELQVALTWISRRDNLAGKML
jgi:ribonuclease HI